MPPVCSSDRALRMQPEAAGHERGAPRRSWSEADLRTLREQFADTRTDDLAQVLGRPYSSIAQKAAKLGLRKSAAYLASPAAHRLDGLKGMGSRFTPGQEAWNKGLKGVVGVQEACRATQFKAGSCNGRAAQLVVPVGSYRVNADGILDQKISDTPGLQTLRWKPVHRLVWERANGPVPHGFVVVFLSGRKTTDPELITIDALELITRQELMRRNTVHRYGREIAHVAQLRGAITRQINKRAKNEP